MVGKADGVPARRQGSVRGVVGGRNLPAAILVGVVMAAFFLGSLVWHPLAFTVVVGLIMLVAGVESHRVLRDAGYPLQLPVLLSSMLAMVFGTYHLGTTGQAMGVLVLLVGSMVWQLVGADRPSAVRAMAVTVLFGLWIGFLGSFAVLLVRRPEIGVTVVLAVIGAAILADIGGYAFGVTFGRHPLAPRVSPNKSWEGLVGGLVVATVAGATILPILHDGFSTWTGALIAFAAAVASVIGDLAESMIKRDLGVKDLGDVLPGHGGILDRVDGILLALPVGYVIVALLF